MSTAKSAGGIGEICIYVCGSISNSPFHVTIRSRQEACGCGIAGAQVRCTSTCIHSLLDISLQIPSNNLAVDKAKGRFRYTALR